MTIIRIVSKTGLGFNFVDDYFFIIEEANKSEEKIVKLHNAWKDKHNLIYQFDEVIK